MLKEGLTLVPSLSIFVKELKSVVRKFLECPVKKLLEAFR